MPLNNLPRPKVVEDFLANPQEETLATAAKEVVRMMVTARDTQDSRLWDSAWDVLYDTRILLDPKWHDRLCSLVTGLARAQ